MKLINLNYLRASAATAVFLISATIGLPATAAGYSDGLSSEYEQSHIQTNYSQSDVRYKKRYRSGYIAPKHHFGNKYYYGNNYHFKHKRFGHRNKFFGKRRGFAHKGFSYRNRGKFNGSFRYYHPKKYW